MERTGILGVFGVFIMPGAAREVGTQRMFVAGQCAVCDTVTVFIEIATPVAFQIFEVFFAQHFAAIHRCGRIFKWFAHPLVHAHIEIREDKDRSLNAFGNIECLPAKIKTFVDIAGQKDERIAITVTDRAGEGEVSL